MKNVAIILALLFSGKIYALELEGRTDFSLRLPINVGVSGYVAEIFVTRGQSVKQGERLLSLDPSRFQVAVERAQAQVKTRTPAFQQMSTEFEKAQELYDRDSLSQVELQQAENNLLLAEAELDMAKAELNDAQLGLKQTNLHAPVNGLILRVNTYQNRFVNTHVADQTLVNLVNNQQMHAIAGLTTEQWNPELLGKSAMVKFRDKSFSGKVISVANDRDIQDSNQSLYELRVLFVARGEIPANMPVTIEIQE